MKLNSLIPELYCTDIHISKKFYINILGFKILYERAEENFVMLEYQGSHLMLDEIIPDKRTWFTGTMEKPFGRGINLQIDSDEVGSMYDRIKKSGYTVFMEPEDKWYRQNEYEVGNRQFLIQDPDGYLLRFAQDLGERLISE